MDIEKILNDQKSLSQVLVFLYNRQTSQEKDSQATIELNGRGFNAIDATFLSSLAEQVLKGRILSAKQVLIAQLRLRKYQHQILEGGWEHIKVAEPVNSNSNGILEYDGDGGMQFRPNVYPSKQIKELGFTRWENGVWRQAYSYLSASVIESVRSMFGDIDVSAELEKTLVEYEAPAVQLPDNIQNHELLFAFQKEATEFALARKRCMIGLAPGLGKTACAIFAAQAAGCSKILVIAPLSLLFTWRNEIKKWIGESSAIVHGKNLLVPSRWTITNYDTLRLNFEKFQVAWECIIIDESVLVKNRKASRTKRVKELVINCKPKYLWLLSGSPTTRLLDDMWAQLNIINPKRFSSYWRFTERYCYVENDQWGWHILNNRPDAATSIAKDLYDVYFARTQDQVLDLPDWIFDDVAVPMSPEQDKLYGMMEEQFIVGLEDGSTVMAPNQLAQMVRLLQLASNPALVGGKNVSAKWDAVVDLLSFEKLPAIVWTQFVQTAAELFEKIGLKGYRIAKLTGITKTEERQQIVDQFQNGEIDVLVAHPGVGKFGLTLTAAHTAIYVERGYLADDYYQSLHRVRRIGTKSSPHVIHILAERTHGGNTIDFVVGQILKTRKDNSIAITTGWLRKLFLEDK